jgi:hypothetical protein
VHDPAPTGDQSKRLGRDRSSGAGERGDAGREPLDLRRALQRTKLELVGAAFTRLQLDQLAAPTGVDPAGGAVRGWLCAPNADRGSV